MRTKVDGRRLALAAGTRVVHLRDAIHATSGRTRALFVAIAALACSAWSLLPDVNDVLNDWAGAMSSSTSGLLTGAFSGQLGSVAAGEWNVATAMTGKFGMVMGVVAVGLCAVEIIAGIITGDTHRIGYAVVWALLAWPATATAVWLIIRITGAVDQLAIGMLDSSGSAEAIALAFSTLLAGAAVQPLMLVVWAVVMWIPSLVLSLVMAFRNYSLLLLVGFAPAAVMSQGWRALRPVAAKWAQAVAALIVTKVFCAGILVLAMDLVTRVADLGAFITGVVGLWMACTAPAAAMAVMSWAGGHVSDAVASRASSAARNATAPARNAAGTTTNRMVDQAFSRVRESMAHRMTSTGKETNSAPKSAPAPNTKAASPSNGSAAAGPAKAAAGAGGPASGAAASTGGAGAAAGGAAGGAGAGAAGGAAAGASAGAAAGPIGAIAGAGIGLAKSGVDKVRSAVAGAAAQGTPDAASGHRPDAGAGQSGGDLRSAVAAMSSANDHMLTAPGSSHSPGSGDGASAPGLVGGSGGLPGGGGGSGASATIRTAPGGPGGGGAAPTPGAGESTGAAAPASPEQPSGRSSARTAPGPGTARSSAPRTSDGTGSGPSLFGGR